MHQVYYPTNRISIIRPLFSAILNRWLDLLHLRMNFSKSQFKVREPGICGASATRAARCKTEEYRSQMHYWKITDVSTGALHICGFERNHVRHLVFLHFAKWAINRSHPPRYSREHLFNDPTKTDIDSGVEPVSGREQIVITKFRIITSLAEGKTDLLR